MIRTYFTLEDLILKAVGETTVPDELIYGQGFNDNAFVNILNEFSSIIYASGDIEKSAEANKLFCEFICPRNIEMGVGYIDHFENEDITQQGELKVYENFWRKYLLILHSTYDRYAKMISIYNAEKAKLMDSVKTTSESKFNDTPQNVQGTFSFDTDKHLTNVTRNDSTTELGTKMQRIDEINRLLRDYYMRWANEFKGVFIFI